MLVPVPVRVGQMEANKIYVHHKILFRFKGSMQMNTYKYVIVNHRKQLEENQKVYCRNSNCSYSTLLL